MTLKYEQQEEQIYDGSEKEGLKNKQLPPIRVSAEEKKEIEDLARKEGRSVSNFIRFLVRYYKESKGIK